MDDPAAAIRTILVPLDGSPFSEQALPLARALARAASAAVELVLVHRSLFADPSLEGLPSIEQMDAEVRAEEMSSLDRAVERLAGDGVEATARLLEGPGVARALRDHAEAAGADLIVMCTHGRGGFARAWLGSVVDELARTAPVPILLVRPDGAAPAGEREATPAHILAALGTEADTAAALRHLAPLAGLLGARVTLLRVVPPPLRVAGRTFGADEARYRAVSARARTELEELARRLEEAGVPARGHVLSHAHPATAILDFASAHAVELIAVGAGRRSGPERLLLGSVADKVVRGATVPVLLLPTG